MPIYLHPTRPADLDQCLAAVDSLAVLGAKPDHPKLKPARKLAERMPAIRQAAAELYSRHDAGAQVDAAADRWLAGELATDELPSVAAAIDACGAAAANTFGNNTADGIMDRAQRNIDNDVSDACRELGDIWITEVLRPAVQRTMEAVAPELIADAWTAVNMSTDDRNEATARPLRAALEKVEDIITALDLLGDWAITWRNYGWVPTPPRSTGWQAEDFRWLHHDKLGDPQHGTYAAFWLAGVRNGAEHGIWTVDEILQASAEPEKPLDQHQTDDEVYAAMT